MITNVSLNVIFFDKQHFLTANVTDQSGAKVYVKAPELTIGEFLEKLNCGAFINVDSPAEPVFICKDAPQLPVEPEAAAPAKRTRAKKAEPVAPVAPAPVAPAPVAPAPVAPAPVAPAPVAPAPVAPAPVAPAPVAPAPVAPAPVAPTKTWIPFTPSGSEEYVATKNLILSQLFADTVYESMANVKANHVEKVKAFAQAVTGKPFISDLVSKEINPTFLESFNRVFKADDAI